MSHIQSVTTEQADRFVDLTQRAAFNRQRNALVPAVNVPPEILTIIFEFACSPDGEEDWVANVDLHTQQTEYRDWGCSVSACAVTPLFIGAICSAWRNIAWSAPHLWNSITLLYSGKTAETLAEMLDYWLSKSGELPLSVALEGSEEFPPTADTSTKVIGVIAAYAHRLHTLNLYLPGQWEPALIHEATSCTPLLTRLTIRMSNNDDRDDITIAFADAPQLREVILSGIYTTDIALPWAQLESLELNTHTGYDDVSELVEILHLCPRLRHFSVPLHDLDWDAPQSASLRHTALETLEVNGYYEKWHPELFKMLELPALRSFVLQINKFTPGPLAWSAWLPSLLSHVAGTLETLRISPETPPDEELPTVLRAVPGLRKLVLCNLFATSSKIKLTQRILDLMNPTKYEGLEREGIRRLDGGGDWDGVGTTGLDERGIGHCLVPNLETFEYEGKIDFTSHALVEFLVARWRGCHPPMRCTSAFALENPLRQLSGRHERGAHGPLPPNDDMPSMRLRSVTFTTPKQIQFEGADAEVVQGLRLEGMHLEFLKSPF